MSVGLFRLVAPCTNATLRGVFLAKGPTFRRSLSAHTLSSTRATVAFFGSHHCQTTTARSSVWSVASTVVKRHMMTSHTVISPTDVYVIDMRSDVLTKPTEAVRQAMVGATADDDVFREDPTVEELETSMATLFGKEAGLFVPSGTMGNLIGMSCHCPQRGLEIIMGDKSHTFLKEQGGVSQFCGLHVRPIPNDDNGAFDLDVLEESIRPKDDPHEPHTGLIVVESTHNYCGGKVIPLEFLAKVRAIADKHRIPVHLDGARALNASVALNITPAELARNVDSVSFCFSKGVGAPVGTVLVGSRALIARALRMRKALGGGWRKPGGLAAAALVAMRDAEERIKKDHEHARIFAKGVAACENYNGVLRVDIDDIQSNIVLVQVVKPGLTAAEFCKRLGVVGDKEETKNGNKSVIVKVNKLSTGKGMVRFVLYSTLSGEDVKRAVEKIRIVLDEYRGGSS